MRKLVLCAATALSISILAPAQKPASKGDSPSQILWTYSGQVVNTTSNPPTSRQFGTLYGVAQAASGDIITFNTEATTTSVRQSGPLRIVERTGTTRIFSDGTPPDATKDLLILASLRQVVVVDTTTGTFTATNFNKVEQSTPLHTSKTLIAAVGQQIKSTLTGHMNSPNDMPSGWFGGFAETVP